MSTTTTKKEYKTKFKGYDITIPKGSLVGNHTACGDDDNYRFWIDYSEIAKELTGYDDSSLAHDLEYYGINIPSKYCNSYDKEGV